MAHYKKKKFIKTSWSNDLLFEVVGFIILNLVLLHIGGRHSEPLLKKYPNEPLKAIGVSVGLTTTLTVFYFFIWEPFKQWFKKTWL